MAKPELKSGIYSNEEGRLFAYKGEDSEEEVSKRPYFNTHIHFPDGTDNWEMEDSTFIRRYKRLELEEINTRIENLSLRKTRRNSQLREFLEQNKNLYDANSSEEETSN